MSTINDRVHDKNVEFQEFMIMPVHTTSFGKRINMRTETFLSLKIEY